MNATLLPVSRACPALVSAVLVAGALPAWADDVTTRSGTMFRDVRMVRVDPDGVTWEYAAGMVKVDFSDLPDVVCKTYHYDAANAAAFKAAQAKAWGEVAARTERMRLVAEARRARQHQLRMAATEATPGEFVAQSTAADAALIKSAGEEIAAKEQAEAFRTRDDGTVWDRRLWAVLKLIFGGNKSNGAAFDPKTDLNSYEYQSSLHHSLGGGGNSSLNDPFFTPIYMTKSYYDDVDRAAAFARGYPIRR